MRPDRRTDSGKRPNALRRRGLDRVDWKDTPTLRAFVSDRGKIRTRRVTGLTRGQQRQVANAIKNAREMALLPYPSSTAPTLPAPAGDPTRPRA